VYPGDVDAVTSSATGSGLTECTALHECEFVVQARDTSANNVFNWGAQDWNITIRGKSDWSGYDNSFHRVNDINYTTVVHFDKTGGTHAGGGISIVPFGWSLVGTGKIAYGDSSLAISTDVRGSLVRGDTLRVVSETMEIDSKGVFEYVTSGVGSPYTSVPLSRPYLGDTTVSMQVYKITPNCSTGKYLVKYTP